MEPTEGSESEMQKLYGCDWMEDHLPLIKKKKMITPIVWSDREDRM